MAALGFKKRFVPLILNRSKPHTIRHERKYPIKVGNVLQLYFGLRTKSCVLIGTAPCVKIQEINIYPGNTVLLDGAWLTGEEIEQLAWRDGFERYVDFFNFFEENYALPTNDMRLIYWDPNQLTINTEIYDVFEVRDETC